MSSCKDDDDNESFGPTYLSEQTITITDIVGIPSNVAFDKIVAEVSGACWEVISSVEASYEHGRAVLTLPSTFLSNKLQKVDRSGGDICGFWTGTSSDPDALVAKLGEFIAYNGNVKVGRIYLTDWPGEGEAVGKTFVYYQYADRPFTLTRSSSPSSHYNYYDYSASFKKGWNAYASIYKLPGDGHTTEYTLSVAPIPNETQTYWRFEPWKY